MKIESTSAARGQLRPFSAFAVGEIVDVGGPPDLTVMVVQSGDKSVTCHAETKKGRYTITEVVGGGVSLVAEPDSVDQPEQTRTAEDSVEQPEDEVDTPAQGRADAEPED
jgi:hypothetical protein